MNAKITIAQWETLRQLIKMESDQLMMPYGGQRKTLRVLAKKGLAKPAPWAPGMGYVITDMGKEVISQWSE